MSGHQLSQVLLHVGDSEADGALTEPERVVLRAAGGRVLLVRLSGPFSFCSAKDLVRRTAGLGDTYRAVVLDFAEVRAIDISVAMAFEDMLRGLKEEGASVFISGLGSEPAKLLAKLGVLAQVPPERRIDSRMAALECARDLATRGDAPAAAAGGAATGPAPTA